MFGVSLLKPQSDFGPADVCCPVRGCGHRLPLQPALFRTTSEYRCPLHRIYVAANTFAYEREVDNLLWTAEDDLALLHGGRPRGRDLGLTHDNSERALTWNVFRWLEVSGALPAFLESTLARAVATVDLVYWGYSPEREGVCMPLVRARNAFHEEDADAIEPAVLIDTGDTLIAVDPRMGPGATRSWTPAHWEKYERGGKSWAAEVFCGDLGAIVADKGAFEFLRLWLLGSYMAAAEDKAFVLLHMTPVWSGAPLLKSLGPQLKTGPARQTVSVTWEDVYAHVGGECVNARNAPALLTYLREKSAGYGADGRLRRAFALTPRA